MYLTGSERQEELVPAETEEKRLKSATTILCIISSLVYRTVGGTTEIEGKYVCVLLV